MNVYLDEALLKSLSGSFSSLKQNTNSEDYSGSVTGVFKTLEGYLTKILVDKYNYKIKKYPKFQMFHKTNGNLSDVDANNKISSNCKQHLNNLYRLYKNKRNVYLHADADPAFTAIIQTLQEAKDIANDILNEISVSYSAFKK